MAGQDNQNWMDMEEDEYMAQHPPRRKKLESVLAPYWDAIAKFRARDYTLDEIVTYLKHCGVETSVSGLHKYIQRRTERELQRKQAPQQAQNAAVNEDRSTNNPLRRLEGAKSADSFNPIPKPVEIAKD